MKQKYLGFKVKDISGLHDRTYNVVLKLELEANKDVSYRVCEGLRQCRFTLEMKSRGHRLYKYVKSFHSLEEAVAFLYTSDCPAYIGDPT